MKKPGDNVELKILRKGKPQTLQVTLSEIDKPFEKESLIVDLKVLALCQVIFSTKILICSPRT